MRNLITIIALLAGSTAWAEPRFDVARVSRDIEVLASDAFEGRAPATPGEAKSIAYIADRMKDAGLQPAGEDGGWYQKVPLLQSAMLEMPRLELAMSGKTATLVQGEQATILAGLTRQTSIDLRRAPLIFAGYGVHAPERQWDDFKDVDLRGKIIVVLINDPDFETGDGRFGGKAMTYYGRWPYKFEEAARQGAAGVLIVHEDAPASYGWATVANSFSGTTFDIVRAHPERAHSPLEGWIRRDLAEAIFRASGLDFETAKRAAQRPDFKPIALDARLSARYAMRQQVVTSHNVAGLLPGTSRADETVIYTAHWDHIGMGAPDKDGDGIYNGAEDNASGVAAMLELARAHAADGPTARSILFLAVTAEETDMLGSEYYAANPLRPLATTAGVINLDKPLSASAASDFGILGIADVGLLDLLKAEGAKQGRSYTPDPRPEAGFFYRSDHFPLAKRGVPAISFVGGQTLIEGGAARGKAIADAYFADRYHQPNDEYDPAWDSSGVPADLALLHATARTLANGGAWPNWSEASEFRAARDRSAASRR